MSGLPWTAWVLLIASVGVGLIVELAFYLNKKGRR